MKKHNYIIVIFNTNFKQMDTTYAKLYHDITSMYQIIFHDINEKLLNGSLTLEEYKVKYYILSGEKDGKLAALNQLYIY